MAARFYPHVLIVLGANLTQLECTAHFAVQLVLLLRHGYVVLGGGLYGPRQVRIDGPPVWVHVAAERTHILNNRYDVIKHE